MQYFDAILNQRKRIVTTRKGFQFTNVMPKHWPYWCGQKTVSEFNILIRNITFKEYSSFTSSSVTSNPICVLAVSCPLTTKLLTDEGNIISQKLLWICVFNQQFILLYYT